MRVTLVGARIKFYYSVVKGFRVFHEPHLRRLAQSAATSGPRLFRSRVSRSAADGGAAVPAAQPRRSRGRAAEPPLSAAAARQRRHPGARLRGQPARSAAPEARRPALPHPPSVVRGAPGRSLGPTSAPRTQRRCSAPSAGPPGFCSAPPTQRQGRAIRGRAARWARTRAWGAAKSEQFSGASNEPKFAAIGARGAAPRRLQCDCAVTPWPGRAIRGRAAHRARTRARGAAKCGQFSGASNEPIFAVIGARGAAPRRSQCVLSMRDA